MSEFQLSLLALGLIVVAGVYLYGFWQQWRYRRSIGDAFKAQPVATSISSAPPLREEVDSHPDSEPTLLAEQDDAEAGTGDSAADAACGLLNEATDYVVT